MPKQSGKKRVMRYVIKWVVNPYRQDKRTGPLTPVKRDRYNQMLFDEADNMFKEIKKD